MLSLKCLLDGVLLWDVAHGQVLAPKAILTLCIHALALGNCLGEQHSLVGISQLCPLKEHFVK